MLFVYFVYTLPNWITCALLLWFLIIHILLARMLGHVLRLQPLLNHGPMLLSFHYKAK
jgi:hypothetical protein